MLSKHRLSSRKATYQSPVKQGVIPFVGTSELMVFLYVLYGYNVGFNHHIQTRTEVRDNTAYHQ